MDYCLVDAFVNEVYPLIRARYRFMDQRWWMTQDGFWTRSLARDRLMSDLYVLAEMSTIRGEDKVRLMAGVRKAHVMNQIIGRLSPMLHTRVGLPARIEQDVTLMGLTSEPPTPAASRSPVQPSSPGLPVADPGLEQADQGDTASPTGHTP
jgi:hypothetical protein